MSSNTDADLTQSYVRLVRATRLGPIFSGAAPAPTLPVPEGFMMLFTADWHPIDVANRFMMARYKPVKTRRWQNTQRARAQDLAQWWTYLAANGIEWHQVTQSDLEDYESRMAAAVSPITSQQFCTSTVRRRVGTVAGFYDWALAEDSPTAPVSPIYPESKSQGRPIGQNAAFLPHLGTAKVPKVPKIRARGRDPEKDPRPLNLAALDGVLRRLGPAIFERHSVFMLAEWEPASKARRNRLMAEVALYTGMRVDEVASISRLDLIARFGSLKPGLKLQESSLRVRTKGQTFRDVVVPSFILKALMLYHDLERSAAVETARNYCDQSGYRYDEPIELFVNGVEANKRDVGRAVSPEVASRAFTKAVRAEGLTKSVDAFQLDPDTFEPLYDSDGRAMRKAIVVAAHTFHDLRHTFAVSIYKSEVKRGNPEPWNKVKNRLGHASVETTKNIYLRHVDSNEADVADAMTLYLSMQLNAVR